MTYDLFLGDYSYSSWSLRAWLLFDRFGLAARRHMVWFDADRTVAEHLADLGLSPATTVPTLRTPDGAVIGDSLAIAEELAQRHPDAGLWPEDPKARATARALAAEMHCSFSALRSDCPMTLRRAYSGFDPSPEVRRDLARIETLWTHARQAAGGDTPWLCGPYSVADAFFAPVAARIAGFGLPVSSGARDYVDAHLADPSFRRWRAMGQAEGRDLPRYAQDLDTVPWPGPVPRPARPVPHGPVVNDRCPYSGKPVTDFLALDGRVWGFCNPVCRDKTVADPDAWPAFVQLTLAG